ncbi:GNAT family N-acetyltransferase [Mucilaginibacter xinganensis]|uniref:Acetyltransferase (GNAT) domain-containing protein n=1 Tax=Mucilaginibacter xinganensis TaxID=1234841 RepID=A0A223NXZ8_9SPHI|nr:GNAT family N-acetyltransferase [Mucilaginibacter xinganensis]ASU34759.1 Acetyltransferase (GNAT) domain-containing protein [Mucilaginibacter xinganensis]
MTQLFTIADKNEWNWYVQNAMEYDFCHTWHYHHIDTSASSLLFIYEEGTDFIALPLVKRQIPGSTFYDLTCVYGFSGPISNKKMEDLGDTMIENFKAAFLDFVEAGKYVSVFSRMHPFYKQQILLETLGGVHENGLTVVLDLSINIEEQRKRYRQSTMDAVKHAWKKGFKVREEKGPAAVATFIEIYNETMSRVGASDSYLFSETYINQLINTEEYHAKILMVYDGDTVISSTIIIFTNGIIQAHLVGTRTKYLCHSPTKFLVDEITIIGRALGMRYYNLGGGVGFKDDTIFKWKTSFTDYVLPYKSWRFIANPSVYQQLLHEKGIDENSDVDFFPLYRYNQPVSSLISI